MTVYLNNDGLEVRFGSSKATLLLGGTLKTFGELKEVHLKIVGLSVTATHVPIDKRINIPSNSYIDEGILVVDTLFTTGSGTPALNLGLMNDDGDGTFSTLDDDGLDVAIALSGVLDTLDKRIDMNGTQIDTSPVNSANALLPMVPSYDLNTGDTFTAGVAHMVLRYRAAVTS